MPHTILRGAAAVLVSALSLLASAFAPSASAAGADDAQPALSPVFPYCSWWVETSTANSNVAFPDTSAAYWTTPVLLDPSTSIQLKGTFTDGRYYSVQVYDSTGQPAASVFTDASGATAAPTSPNFITDYNLVPDPGSFNPFATGAFAPTPSTYTVTISAVQGSASNWIPMPAPTDSSVQGQLGFVMLRAYLPNNPPLMGQSPMAGIDVTADPPFALLRDDLPTISLSSSSGASTTLATCPAPEASRLVATTVAGASLVSALKADVTLTGNEPCPEVINAGSDATCVERLEFFRTTSGQTPFPNGDSAYVTAKYVLPPGQALVVQAHLPTTPWSVGNGSEVMTWPATSTGKNPAWNLRYLSLCNYIHRPPFPVVEVPSRAGPLWGCANDVQVHDQVGSGSKLLAVVTRAGDRPMSIQGASADGTGFVWLPASRKSADAEMLFSVRNMLASPAFSQSATNIPEPLDPKAARQTMGAYYPSASLCDVRILERFGVLKCTEVHRVIHRCTDVAGLNQTPTGTLQRDGSVRADVRGAAPSVAKAMQACVDELLTVRGTVSTPSGDVRHESGCLLQRRTDCRGLDLRNAQMSSVNLREASLAFSNLSGADLSDARLTDAQAHRTALVNVDLTNTQASGADLTGSRISQATVVGADLSDATLTGVRIVGSDLSRADLSGTDLSGSTVSGTDFTGATTTGVVATGAIAQNVISPSGSRCSGSLADCLAR